MRVHLARRFQKPLAVFRKEQRQIVFAAALLLAFLPSLTFLGHWDELFTGQSRDEVPVSALLDFDHEQAEQTEHTLHCHTGLASCGAQPMPAGAGLLATHETLLLGQTSQFLGLATSDDWAPLPPIELILTPPPRSS